MFKILNIDPEQYSKEAQWILEGVGKYVGKRLSRRELIEEITDYDALILRFAHKIDRAILKNACNLKIIGTNVTGIDHIDHEYLADLGIKLVFLRNSSEQLKNIQSTAELAWGLLLGLIRRIPWAREGPIWGEWNREQYLGTDLKGKTIGILGFGRIGEKVSEYAIAFGMNVMAFTLPPFPNNPHVEFIVDEEEFFNRCEMLMIHLPLNSITDHFINEKRIKMLPHGAAIVNTARGAIIEEGALLAALENGSISGAAIDVMERELDPKFLDNNPLVSYAKKSNNLIITPHIGGATNESWKRTECIIASEVCAYMKSLQQDM